MQSIHLFGIDFHAIFLAGALAALVAACWTLKRALPRSPRGWR